MLQDAIALLGIANPQLSLAWQDGGLPSEDSTRPLRLASDPAAGEWLAPAGGLLHQAFASRLLMPDGSTPAGSTPAEQPWVLCLHPQVWLRVARLYGLVLEARAAQTDRPQRPVPRYFAFHDTATLGGGPAAGTVAAGGRLQLRGGSLSVHDDAGRPLDPVATACAFVALLTRFPAMISKGFGSTSVPDVAASQLGQVAGGVAAAEVRVRLASLFGVPFAEGEARLTNVTAVDAAAGVYRLDNPAQPILVVVPPPDPNQRLVVGAATFGVLDGTFTSQPLSPGVPLAQLRRDFLSLFADDLNLHLRGRETLVAPFAGLDHVVPTYHDEDIGLLVTGNQALAEAGQAVTGAAGLSLVVSPVIESDYDLAANAGASEWPLFPPGGDGPIAGRLQNVALSAHFLAEPADTRDVFLRMEVPESAPGTPQLAPGTAVRVYNRKFLADAREGRGNGAGGVLDANRTVGFVVANPFGLRQDEGRPTKPTLSFDVVAANRSGGKRSFGLLGTPVDGPRALDAAEAALAARGTNPFNTAPERGNGPAGLLGLPAPALDSVPPITGLASAVDVALSLGDEATQPRVAPRLPTMTRNETVVAGRDAAGNWSAVLGGLWLRRDSRSGLHRLGSPGSPGGEEFLGASIRTRGGLLAQDLARMAFRRTRGLATRLTELDQDDRWTPALAAAPAGTMSAALLQNIAPLGDSPNLALIPDAAFDALPPDWTGVVNAVSTLIPSGLAANNAVRNAINSLASSAKGLLLYNEFRREAVTARHGRRDAVPVLRAALKAARELIYIETSAFSYTGYKDDNPADPENANDPADPETDLVTLIAGRLAAQPGLKVLIGVSKEVPVGIGYETFAGRAYDRRERALEDLRAVDPARVTLFHPIGFPGRPLRLMHTVVIVDDMWLFLGSGSFTRRGLLFDGNVSVALFDRQVEAGRSRAVREFRRRLMENHLGVAPVAGSPAQAFPHPNRARIADVDESYFAFRDTLDQGGAGLIQGLFDGAVTGQPPIPADSYPHRDLADPDGSTFPVTSAALLQLFAGLGDAQA
jgi:hypothetical protein